MKFLPPQWSHDEGAKQRFLREAQAASATNHRNICVIHDIEQTDDGQLFIVMAHYEGQTLKQKLEGGALPVADAIEIAAEVAEGLAKAHAQGVVHRDIKPGNLMVTEDGVKILDFGLAKFADALQLTQPGSTLGTVAYMAPEQARGEEADERSDVWALGVVLYEMLTGEVPFKGSYAEAIFYAIKNEAPAPLAGSGKDIPEPLERIVSRALTKDPAARYQTARELARDLRFLQGRSLPLDLRTEPIDVRGAVAASPQKKRGARVWVGTVAVLAAAGLGAYFWLSRPLVRTPIVVVPIANHTGEPEFDAYRLALTRSLIAEFDDSPNLRVMSYPRTLEILRGNVAGDGDLSGVDAIQRLVSESGAGVFIVPSLEYRNGEWLAHAELRNASTRTSIGGVDTEAVTSSLPKETVQRLVVSLGSRIQAHFSVRWPHRPGLRQPEGRFRTLEAASAFEQGVNAYEQLEYSAARAAFRRATLADPQRPIGHAWLSRASLLIGDTREAEAAARAAVQLVNADTSPADSLFAQATLAEAQADMAGAERRYRQMAELHRDMPDEEIELAAFLKRQSRNEQAVEAYHEALARDSRVVRPHVDLCQLYSALGDYPLSEQHAQTAIKAFRLLGNRGGEGQAMLCQGDQLLQQAVRLKEARQDIEGARDIFASLDYPYALSRVYQYLGFLAAQELDYPTALRAFQEALTRSRQIGNRQIEGLVLMNLGVTSFRMGAAAAAAAYYDQSRDVYQSIGDERRAAEQEVNAAALRVPYANDASVVRGLENARATFRRLGHVDFEVFAMQVMTESELASGRLSDALRLVREAISIATERQLKDRLSILKVRMATIGMLQGDYEHSRQVLEEVGTSAESTSESQIALGRAYVTLGDFGNAKKYLQKALADVQRRGEHDLVHAAQESLGDLAYESGDVDSAKARFAEASADVGLPMPEPAAIHAACRLASLDGEPRARAAHERVLAANADRAAKAGQRLVEARCRLELAAVEVRQGRDADALQTLDQLSKDQQVNLGVETDALAHYWRGRALLASGDQTGAAVQRSQALAVVTRLRDALPEPSRQRFSDRTSIRPLFD